MSDSNILEYCPVWGKPCIQSNCTSYESHTKQRFRNIKTNAFIPIDQLSFYSAMTQEQLDQTIERNIIITHECRNFGRIIEIENKIDHQIPLQF
jgi:hypothetical protein